MVVRLNPCCSDEMLTKAEFTTAFGLLLDGICAVPPSALEAGHNMLDREEMQVAVQDQKAFTKKMEV